MNAHFASIPETLILRGCRDSVDRCSEGGSAKPIRQFGWMGNAVVVLAGVQQIYPLSPVKMSVGFFVFGFLDFRQTVQPRPTFL